MSRQKRGRPEHDLQKAVVEHLNRRAHPGVYFCSIPNGAKMPDHIRRLLVEEGMRPGAPDLLFIANGRPIGLELKALKGKQTDTQKATETDWTLAGGLYAVAVGMDQALQFLEMVGIIKPDVSARAA